MLTASSPTLRQPGVAPQALLMGVESTTTACLHNSITTGVAVNTEGATDPASYARIVS